MTDQRDTSTPRRPLRLWPGVVLAVLLILFRLALPFVGAAEGPPLALLLDWLAVC